MARNGSIGWRTGRGDLAAALVLVLALGLASGAGPAQARRRPSPAAAALARIVRSEGPSADASPILHLRSGTVAFVAHALHVYDRFGDGSHTVGDVLAYAGGRWRRRAHIDFGNDSDAPARGAPPRQVHLTGATDLLVSTAAASVAPAYVVSDVRGGWHLVPFDRPGTSPVTSVIYASVRGSRITSGVDDCKPNCAMGTITHTTWTYHPTADAFEPVGTPPSAPTGPCATSVPVDELVAIGGCLHSQGGGEYASTETVRVNGIDFVPDPGGQITIDTSDARLTATGGGRMKVGAIPLQGWTHGFGFALVPPGQTVTLAQTPGNNAFLGAGLAYATAKFDHDQGATVRGVVDFARVLNTKLAEGTADIHTDNADGIFAGGFRLCASLGNVGVGPYSIITIFNQIPLKSATLCYLPFPGLLTGTATVASPLGPRFVGQLTLATPPLSALSPFGGARPLTFAGFGVGVTQLNQPLAYGFELQRLGFSLQTLPHLGLTGLIGVSWLPSANGLELLSIDGGLGATFGGDDGFTNLFYPGAATDTFPDSGGDRGYNTFTVNGTMRLLGNYTLADAGLSYRTNGNATFYGDIQTPDFLSAVGIAIAGHMTGSVGAGHLEGSASGAFTFDGTSGTGRLALSTKGLAMCGSTQVFPDPFPISFGFRATEPGTHVATFWGCDFSDLAPVANATSARAGGRAAAGATVQVPAGRVGQEIAAHAASGPPLVTLLGPGGESVTAPQQLDRIAVTGDVLAVRDSHTDTTTFLLSHPRGGAWHVVAAPGGTQSFTVAHAGLLRPLSVRARVTGRGSTRTLHWRFDAAPGESVAFREESASGNGTIAVVRRGSGAIRFRPAPGRRGVRRIVAIVEHDGIPRAQRTVARYVASAPAGVGRPRRLRIHRSHGRLTASWSAVRGATGYEVDVTLAHGVAGRALFDARRRSLRLPADTSAVSVRTIARGRGTSRPRTVRLGPRRRQRRR